MFLWLPLPQQDAYQKIRDLQFDSPVAHSQGHEHKVPLDSPSAKLVAMNSAPAPDPQRYLEPDKLVPLSGVISNLARQQTASDTATLVKARHIYDYVVATVRCDKSGEGAELDGKPFTALQTHLSFRDLSPTAD